MKTKAYLEHANITVRDLDAAIKFIQLALPGFKVRGEGENQDGRKWVHIGTDETYLAINNDVSKQASEKDYDISGLNHLGFVVEDVKSLAKRLEDAGYERSYPTQDQKFRIREYFFDAEGNEYEFVEYLSEKPEERNDYSS